MPSLTNVQGFHITSADVATMPDKLTPDNFEQQTGKFEVTDPAEQDAAKNHLKEGLNRTSDSIRTTAHDLYSAQEVNVIDFEGNAVAGLRADVLDLLNKKFLDIDTSTTPATPVIRSEEAATYVDTVYGKDTSGESVVAKINAFVDAIDPTTLGNIDVIISNWTATNADITRAVLKEALVLTLANSKPEEAYQLLTDLQGGSLHLLKSTTVPAVFGGVPVAANELTSYAQEFTKALGYIAKVDATATGLTMGGLFNSLYNTNFPSDQVKLLYVGAMAPDIALGQNLDTTEWTDDGQKMLKGLDTIITTLVPDTALATKLKAVDQPNTSTGPGVIGNDLMKLVHTTEALQETQTRIGTDATRVVKGAHDAMNDVALQAKLSETDPDVFATIQGNVDVKDARRMQVLGIKAMNELRATVTLTDPLPWDSTKTWNDLLASMDSSIGAAATSVDVMNALSQIEKVALLSTGATKDVATKYLYAMIAQQLFSLPQGEELVNELDGKPLAQQGEVMYLFLTDATKLNGDRNIEMVNAAELWLAVLKNFTVLSDVVTRNAAADPSAAVAYNNLINYLAIDTNNLINYGAENAAEAVQGLKAAEIARVLGVPEDDPAVKKILESNDPTKALSNETSRMTDIFAKLKGKAFSLATAGALSAVSLAVGGGPLLLVAGLGLAAFNVAKGVKEAGGWKNFFKGFGQSIKNAFVTLGQAFNPNSGMSRSERAWAIGTTVIGTLARILVPGGGALAMGVVELGAAASFEMALSAKQQELKTAMDTVLTDLNTNPTVSITPAGGAATNVKMLPYIKLYVRELDKRKAALGDTYDEAQAIVDMKNAHGELEKAALVYEQVKTKREAAHLMEKYDGVSRVLGNYNAMLAGSIAANVISMGARATNFVMDKLDTFADNQIDPRIEEVKQDMRNFGERVGNARDAAADAWRDAWNNGASDGAETGSTNSGHQTAPNDTDTSDYYNRHDTDIRSGVDVGAGAVPGAGDQTTQVFNHSTSGALNLPGSAWNGTTMEHMDGGNTLNPSHYYGGSDGMAARLFHDGAVNAAGGDDYLNKLFHGDATSAHKVLNAMKSHYNGYYNNVPNQLDYDFADAYKEVTGNQLP